MNTYVRKAFNKKNITIFVVISLILCFSLFFTSNINEIFNHKVKDVYSAEDFTVHYLSVGQADCIAINLPDGKVMLIDGGVEYNSFNDACIKSRQTIISYLDEYVMNGDNVIDYLLLTHSDTDHCSGMCEILDQYQVNYIYRPAAKAVYNNYETETEGENVNLVTSEIYQKTIEAFNNEPTLVNPIISRSGLFINGEDYLINFLSPLTDKYLEDSVSDSANAMSAIVQITYKTKKFLFMGDSNFYSENLLKNSFTDIDVLKVGHHGSNSSTSEYTLSLIKPEYAVISVGKDNNYGLPNEELLNRLSGYVDEDNIFRTDTDGDVIIGINQSGEIFTYDFTQASYLMDWLNIFYCLMLVNIGYFLFPKKKHL